jgi:hypothetical protein
VALRQTASPWPTTAVESKMTILTSGRSLTFREWAPRERTQGIEIVSVVHDRHDRREQDDASGGDRGDLLPQGRRRLLVSRQHSRRLAVGPDEECGAARHAERGGGDPIQEPHLDRHAAAE